MKRNGLIVIRSCVLGTALLIAGVPAAQAAGRANRARGGAATTQPGGQHEPGQALERIKKALAQLDLTPDQQTKADGILADAKTKLEALRGEAKSGDRQGMRDKIKAIIKDIHQQLGSVLTDEQKTKLREIHQEHHSAGPTTQK